MLVLTVDTSTPAVTAGLVRLSGASAGACADTLAVRVTRDARAHAEVLTPQITECLRAAGAAAADLDAVVVGSGPGPFTGLRVGMVTGAAFGDALGVPVHGVCSLDAIAVQAREESRDTVSGRDAPGLPEEFLVVTDARRREVYWARYRGVDRTEGPAVARPADVEARGAAAAAGSAGHIASLGLAAVGPQSPSPWGLVTAAAPLLTAGAAPAPLEPLYLRRPDATEPKPRVRPARAPA